jgi:DNA-binding transcriptional ArsR family regulator
MAKNEPMIDQVFRALGDSTRRAMMERLTDGPVSVSRLAEPFELTLAAVVQHMQVLEECGLVRTEKVGRVRTCSIDPAGLDAAAKWINERRSPWEQKLDRLGEILAESDERPEEESEPEWLG